MHMFPREGCFGKLQELAGWITQLQERTGRFRGRLIEEGGIGDTEGDVGDLSGAASELFAMIQ